MKIVGVNGIRTDGAGNIDRLLLEMKDRGFETRDVTLPIAHAWTARCQAKREGKMVAQASADGDIVVAHSYGCLRTFHAHRRRDYRAIVYIAPAMAADVEWEDPERVHCWYSPDDWAIKLGSWLLFHPFGAAGNKGFSQPGVANHPVAGCGHNDFFVGLRIRVICDYISTLV